MDFPSLNVMVHFCDFSLGPQDNNNFIKDNNALQKQTSGKGRSLQFWCDWFLFCGWVSAGEFELQFLRMTILSVKLNITLRTAAPCSISENQKKISNCEFFLQFPRNSLHYMKDRNISAVVFAAVTQINLK